MVVPAGDLNDYVCGACGEPILGEEPAMMATVRAGQGRGKRKKKVSVLIHARCKSKSKRRDARAKTD